MQPKARGEFEGIAGRIIIRNPEESIRICIPLFPSGKTRWKNDCCEKQPLTPALPADILGKIVASSLGYPFRALLQAPGISLVSILTISIGVSAAAALFSIVEAVLLNPLPFPDPARLVWISELNDAREEIAVAWGNFRDWRAGPGDFSHLATYATGSVTFIGPVEPEHVDGAVVSEEFSRPSEYSPHWNGLSRLRNKQPARP